MARRFLCRRQRKVDADHERLVGELRLLAMKIRLERDEDGFDTDFGRLSMNRCRAPLPGSPGAPAWAESATPSETRLIEVDRDVCNPVALAQANENFIAHRRVLGGGLDRGVRRADR